jgi:hypothetical protein
MIVGLVGVLVAAGIAIGGKRRRAMGVAGLCAVLIGTGLVIANFDDDGGKSTPQSLTPRITSTPSGALDSLLLTAADVRSIAGLEGLIAHELGDVDLFENPDPRGPCGAPGADLPTSGAAGRAFEGDGQSLVQLVIEGQAATDFLDSQLADIREPCGPYDSKTNTGATQHVEDIEVHRLQGGDGFFETASIRSDRGRATISDLAVRVGDRVSFALGIGHRIAGSDFEALAELVRDRLS